MDEHEKPNISITPYIAGNQLFWQQSYKGSAAVRHKIMRKKQSSLDRVGFIPREKLCLTLCWSDVAHGAWVF